MIEQHLSLNDFIQAKEIPSKDINWPSNSPFNLKFKCKKLNDEQKTSIKGCGIYLISCNNTGEVVYIGMYRPIAGNIINDRWGRHLQTITGRGYNIGLGGKNNSTARRANLLDGVEVSELREAIDHAFKYSLKDRFRDTGYSTTPNRLRFASENWSFFGPANGNNVLDNLTFSLFSIRLQSNSEEASREVESIEKKVLKQFKPICNAEYKHFLHEKMRSNNSIDLITEAIREGAKIETGQDIAYKVTLKGKASP